MSFIYYVIGSGMIRGQQLIKNMVANKLTVNTPFPIFLCMAMWILAVSPKAEAQLAEDTTIAPSSELKIASIEQSYDQQIIQILSNYFDRTKFYVDVNISTQVVEETFTTRQNRIRQQQSDDITMPGLPFLPDENRQRAQRNEPPETVVNERTVPSLRLKNLNIDIYADSSFTSDELEFMKMIAGIAAKTDDARGDNITVRQVSMPNFGSSASVASVDTSGRDSSFSNLSEIFALLNQYLPGVILLLVVGLLVFVGRLSNKSQSSEGFTHLRQRDSYSNVDNPTQDERLRERNKGEADTKSEFDKLIEKFLSKPKEISLLFESWIDEDSEEGITRAAKVVNTVDKNLIKSIKHVLTQEHYSAIANAAEQMPAMSLQQKKEIAQEFNALLQPDDANSPSSNKNKQLPLFKFLDHISDEQTLALIKNENIQAAALIVNYLSQQKAAQLLDKLDDSRATDIMLEMTKLQDLPYKKQKEISSQLFEKAMNLLYTREDDQHDPRSILPVLESLPVQEQRRYIENLKAKGTSVGEFIEDYFITIEQIPDLDDELLRNATRTINTETLLDAIIGLDEAVTEKLLSVRPQREQRLIRLELEQIEDEEEFDTSYAKSRLMNMIRKTANQNNI